MGHRDSYGGVVGLAGRHVGCLGRHDRTLSVVGSAPRNPNGEGLVEWPAYNTQEQYLEINLKQKVSMKLKEKKVEFWLKTVPEKVDEVRRKHTEL